MTKIILMTMKYFFLFYVCKKLMNILDCNNIVKKKKKVKRGDGVLI
jgi:hypothetical protein